MELFEGDITNLVSPSWRSECRAHVAQMQGDVARYRTSLRMLEQLVAFPSKRFLVQQVGLGLIKAGLYDACIVIAWRLLGDTRSTGFIRLRHMAEKKAISTQARMDLQRLLPADVVEQAAKALTRVRSTRHNLVAHRNAGAALDPTKIERPQLKDLGLIGEELHRHLNAFAMDSALGTYFLDFAPNIENRRPNYTTDLDDMLIGLLCRTGILHLPERSPEQWNFMKPEESELAELNRYRRLAGLAPARTPASESA